MYILILIAEGILLFYLADNFVLLVPDADWLVQIKLEAYRIKANSQ